MELQGRHRPQRLKTCTVNRGVQLTLTFYEHCPLLIRPSRAASNATELVFDKLDSGYKVGTAGSKGGGRGETIQLCHGSEVAYWPNADTHVAGLLQAVPDAAGTEIILESTSNGPLGLFADMCKAASRGEGDYILVFIPWFWQAEYRKPVPDGFTPSTATARRRRREWPAASRLRDDPFRMQPSSSRLKGHSQA